MKKVEWTPGSIMKGLSVFSAFLVFISIAIVLTPGVTRSASSQNKTKAGPGPFILISIDTLRADHLGMYGYPRPTSPRLDDFAKTAVIFEQAYASEPWTLPSHVTILTGLPPEVHHLTGLADVLDPKIVTLAQVFKKNGYRTGGFIDNVLLSNRYKLNRGYDFYDEQKGGAANIFPRAVKWLQSAGPKSFLFIHIFDCHGPYKSAPDNVRRKFQSQETEQGRDALQFLHRLRSETYQQFSHYSSLEGIIDAYDAGIAHSDAMIGTFFDQLKQMALFEQSVIAVVSDHGESLFERGIYVGHSHFLYEEEMRVPLLIRLPEGAGGGHRVSVPVSLVSVFRTLTDLAGIVIREEAVGPSLKPLLFHDNHYKSSPIFMQSSSLDETRGVRLGDWKWIEAMHNNLADALDTLGPQDEETAALLRIRIQTGEQLFSMSQDPGERHNLASEKRTLSSFFEEQLCLYEQECRTRARGIRLNQIPLSP